MTKKLLVTISCAILAACGGGESFESAIPKPAWYDSVPLVKIDSVDDVNALWRGKKRCCIDDRMLLDNNREFFKACYDSIARNAENEELIVKCLWLMNSGADKEQRIGIRRFLIGNYGDHRNSTENCSNCSPADTLARATRDLAQMEKAQGQTDHAINLMENILDARRSEISHWVQVEIYQSLGDMYLSSTVTNARKDRINTAYNRLNNVRREDNGVERRFERFESTYRDIMAR